MSYIGMIDQYRRMWIACWDGKKLSLLRKAEVVPVESRKVTGYCDLNWKRWRPSADVFCCVPLEYRRWP